MQPIKSLEILFAVEYGQSSVLHTEQILQHWQRPLHSDLIEKHQSAPWWFISYLNASQSQHGRWDSNSLEVSVYPQEDHIHSMGLVTHGYLLFVRQ